MSAAASSSADAGTAKHHNELPVSSRMTEADLLRQLHTMLYAQIPTRRAFVCTGHIPVVPTLRMGETDNPMRAERPYEQELGTADDRLYQILSADNIEYMQLYASPSQFGRGPDTLYDPTVRSGLDMLPIDVWIDCLTSESAPDNYMDWFRLVSCSRLSPLLEQIRQQLAPRTPAIRARPYKLNLYTAGDHFTSHTDAPISADHFGTLLIFLPAQHTGGELRISHEGLSETFSFGSVSACEADVSRTVVGCDWVAFYTDCHHEVRPVIDGHRVSMAYTLHIGEHDSDHTACFCGSCGNMRSHTSAAGSKQQRHEEDAPDVLPMEHIFDVASISHEEEEKQEVSHQTYAAASASAASSSFMPSGSVAVKAVASPVAPLNSDTLLLPLAWHQLHRVLQSADFATYRLPADVVDIVLSYLADASPLHQLFALPDRTFQRVALLLAHGYPYAAIASNSVTTEKEISTAVSGVSPGGAASDAAPSSSPAFTRAVSTGSVGLPSVTALNSPPARFFLKGRDRDIFDSLQATCAGSNLHVRVVPVHVHVNMDLYRGEWDVTSNPAEVQLLDEMNEHPEWRNPLQLSDTSINRRSYSPSPHLTVEEVLSFTLHGGTVDRVAHALTAPETVFVNQANWLELLLSQRAVHSMHEADAAPNLESVDQLSHAKRGFSYGAYVNDCTGNCGYHEEIELQYISAAIIVEEMEEETDD
jgi:hypothetical protein